MRRAVMTIVAVAALAVAGEDTTGEELVTAIVAAYDVVGRVSLAMNAASARGRACLTRGRIPGTASRNATSLCLKSPLMGKAAHSPSP